MFWDLLFIMHHEAFQLLNYLFLMHICISVGQVVFNSLSSNGIQGNVKLNVEVFSAKLHASASTHIRVQLTSATSQMNSTTSGSFHGKG
jgi:hypothetical protein